MPAAPPLQVVNLVGGDPFLCRHGIRLKIRAPLFAVPPALCFVFGLTAAADEICFGRLVAPYGDPELSGLGFPRDHFDSNRHFELHAEAPASPAWPRAAVMWDSKAGATDVRVQGLKRGAERCKTTRAIKQRCGTCA